MFASWFRPRRSVLLGLEALEDRSLPSTSTVTNLLDSGANSLRAAIAAAGNGDTIDFAGARRVIAAGVPAFIDLGPGNVLAEAWPAGLLDGKITFGSVHSEPMGSATFNDASATTVPLQSGSFETTYDLGERPVANALHSDPMANQFDLNRDASLLTADWLPIRLSVDDDTPYVFDVRFV